MLFSPVSMNVYTKFYLLDEGLWLWRWHILQISNCLVKKGDFRVYIFWSMGLYFSMYPHTSANKVEDLIKFFVVDKKHILFSLNMSRQYRALNQQWVLSLFILTNSWSRLSAKLFCCERGCQSQHLSIYVWEAANIFLFLTNYLTYIFF